MLVQLPVASSIVHRPSSIAFSTICLELIAQQLIKKEFPVRFDARVSAVAGVTYPETFIEDRTLFVHAHIAPPWINPRLLESTLPTLSAALVGVIVDQSSIENIKVIHKFRVLGVTLRTRQGKALAVRRAHDGIS